jgi:hypothetical protein
MKLLNIIAHIGFAVALTQTLLFCNIDLKAQTFAEVDFVVTNKMYDFLIEYEKTVSNEAFSKEELKKFYYNENVEVYNDLTPELPEYISLIQYLNVLDTIKEKNPKFESYHYNLELIKQQNGLYFDIVHIRLLKETVNNSVDKGKSINSTNVIRSNVLDYTLLFNKFQKDGVFQILKIEKAEESLLPDAWHRKSIPDEVRISIGPSFVNFDNISNDLITNTKNNGFDGAITIQNRFTGGNNIAVSWFFGVGATYINSKWNLNYDSIDVLNQVDNFGDSYTRRIITNDIEQEMNMLYLKAPFGIAVRLFNPDGFSLTFSGEIAPRYLLNSNYKTDHGKITYSGIYSETINGQTYPFYLTNLGSNENNDYDFYTNAARNRKQGINLDNFGGTVGFSIQASYKIRKHFDIFIAPAWRWGITDLFSGNSGPKYLALNNWEINPVIEQENNLNFNVTSIEAGIIFRLNNVVKPFIKNTKFKDKERREQKENFKEFLVNQIPYNPPMYASPERKKVEIDVDKKVTKSLPEIQYSFSQKTGIEKSRLKPGKTNKIKTPYKGLFLFKPFGYDISSPSDITEYGDYSKILTDSLNTDLVGLNMSYLPELNVSIIMKMNDEDDQFGIRDKIIQTYRKNASPPGDKKCALYFYEMHGSNIKQIFEKGEEGNFCFSCNDPSNSIDLIEKKTNDGPEPIISFMNELRILMKDEFLLERRKINLDFYIGNSKSFVSAFNSLQHLENTNNLGREIWSDEKDAEKTKKDLETLGNLFRDNPVKVNQFKNITFYIGDLYYTPREDWQKPEFIRNTHKMLYQYIKSKGTGKKSIRLRNFEFKQM